MKSIIRAFNNKKSKNPFVGNIIILTSVISESLFKRRVIREVFEKVVIKNDDYLTKNKQEILNFLEEKSRKEYEIKKFKSREKSIEDDQK